VISKRLIGGSAGGFSPSSIPMDMDCRVPISVTKDDWNDNKYLSFYTPLLTEVPAIYDQSSNLGYIVPELALNNSKPWFPSGYPFNGGGNNWNTTNATPTVGHTIDGVSDVAKMEFTGGNTLHYMWGVGSGILVTQKCVHAIYMVYVPSSQTAITGFRVGGQSNAYHQFTDFEYDKWMTLDQRYSSRYNTANLWPTTNDGSLFGDWTIDADGTYFYVKTIFIDHLEGNHLVGGTNYNPATCPDWNAVTGTSETDGIGTYYGLGSGTGSFSFLDDYAADTQGSFVICYDDLEGEGVACVPLGFDNADIIDDGIYLLISSSNNVIWQRYDGGVVGGLSFGSIAGSRGGKQIFIISSDGSDTTIRHNGVELTLGSGTDNGEWLASKTLINARMARIFNFYYGIGVRYMGYKSGAPLTSQEIGSMEAWLTNNV
tara:strand:+ start:5865 stop:7151 length:1287 start_codon:yes stop_codon:yes gene_type:complete